MRSRLAWGRGHRRRVVADHTRAQPERPALAGRAGGRRDRWWPWHRRRDRAPAGRGRRDGASPPTSTSASAEEVAAGAPGTSSPPPSTSTDTALAGRAGRAGRHRPRPARRLGQQRRHLPHHRSGHRRHRRASSTACSQVNVRGTFAGAREAARRMTGGGVIVNVASTAGFRAAAGISAYVASKHAVVGLTKNLALELGPAGIRVVGVAPGVIDTPGRAGAAGPAQGGRPRRRGVDDADAARPGRTARRRRPGRRVPRLRPRGVGHRRRGRRRRRRTGRADADGRSTDRAPAPRRCATSSPAPRRPRGSRRSTTSRPGATRATSSGSSSGAPVAAVVGAGRPDRGRGRASATSSRSTISKVPVLIVRGKDDELRAFYNTCQHRGAPVVRDTPGTARTLRCQYHSWTYDITDGRLVAVPDERDFVGLDKATRCLPRLRCEIWDGWVFVNQDLEAVPLLDWLAPIPEQLAELQGPTLRAVATAQRGRAVQLEGHRRGLPRGVPLPPHPPARRREPPRQPGRHDGSAAERRRRG